MTFQCFGVDGAAHRYQKLVFVSISMIWRFVFIFLIFFARFHEIFLTSFLQVPSCPSQGGVSGILLHKHGCITKTKRLLEKWPKCSAYMVFFCRNVFKFGSLPTAIINFNACLQVTQCLNRLLLYLSSRSWFKLTVRKVFSRWNFSTAEKLAGELRKDFFSEVNRYIFLLEAFILSQESTKATQSMKQQVPIHLKFCRKISAFVL